MIITTTKLMMMIVIVAVVVVVVVVVVVIKITIITLIFTVSLSRERALKWPWRIHVNTRSTRGALITCSNSCATWYERTSLLLSVPAID